MVRQPVDIGEPHVAPSPAEEGHCLVDPEGRIRSVDLVWLKRFVLTPNEVVGRPFTDLFPESSEVVLALCERVREGNEVTVPGIRLWSSGLPFWWSGRISPVAMAGGIGARITVTESGSDGDRPLPSGPLPEVRPSDERPLQEQYRSFVEESSGIVWWLNQRGECAAVAPAWIEFTGQSVEEASGLGYLAAIHPEDRDLVIAAWKAASASPHYYEVEYRLRRRDGVYRVMLSRGMPTAKDPQGAHGYVGTCTDITERKEAEEALREAARKNELDRGQLAAIFQAMRDSVYVFDMEGRLVFVNDAEARSLGLRGAEELVQRNALLTAAASLGGDSREGRHLDLEMQNLDGTPVPEEEWPSARVLRGISERNRELLVRHRLRAEARHESITTQAVYDDEGKQILGLVVARDVTQEREREEKLRESEELLRTLADNMIQLAWAADEKGRLYWANRRFLEFTGASMGELRERGREVFGRLEESDPVADRYRHAIETGEPWDDFFSLRGADGQLHRLQARATPVRDGAGQVIRWFGTATDVTEQWRIEEELREADRRRNEFLGVLSHELRNPLAPIRNSLYVLNKTEPGASRGVRALEVIDRQTRQLAGLVDDLLDVTRISHGKVELNLGRVDLREAVRSACDDHHSLFVKGEIALQVSLPPRPVWIEGDGTRIAQAVGNLLQNSAKFTHSLGRVEVALSVRGDRASVSVRDTGIGIAPEDLPGLFSMFKQGEHRRSKDVAGGLGLGLALVKGFVELHGGSVRAMSDGPDRGAEFVLEFPVEATRPDTAGGPPSAVSEGYDEERRLVLVIEDNVDAGDSLVEVLTLNGHEVKLARDGRSGLAMAREERPQVIVCDIGLPDMDGYQVARELRREESFRGTKLIALTGYAQPEDRKRALEAGFDAHLPKPPPLDALEALVVVH